MGEVIIEMLKISKALISNIYLVIFRMLRVAQSSDLSFIYRLYMHRDTNPWLLYEQMDEASFQPIYYDLISRELLFVFEIDGQPRGMIKLLPQKFRNSHIIYLGGVAIDPDHAGKGLGGAMIAEAIDLAQGRGFSRIELTVATINKRAVCLYEKLGFVNEGVLRNYTYLSREEKYIDEYVMSLLIPTGKPKN